MVMQRMGRLLPDAGYRFSSFMHFSVIHHLNFLSLGIIVLHKNNN